MMNKLIKKLQNYKLFHTIKRWHNNISEKMANETKMAIQIKKTQHVFLVIARSTLIIGLCFVILLPIIQQISLAIRAPEDINNPQVVWVPENFTLMNLKIAAIVLDFKRALINNLLVSTIMTACQILSTAVVGYAFAKLRFKGHNILFFFVIATIVIPPQTVALTQFLYFKNFDLITIIPTPGEWDGFMNYLLGERIGVIELITNEPINLLGKVLSLTLMSAFGMGIKSGLFIYIFRQFFRGIPVELEESAEIDGAGVIRTFFSIMLPNAKSAMLTVGLFAFVWQWNDVYYTSLLQLSKPDFPMLTMRLANASENIYQALFYTGALELVGDDVQNNPLFIAMISNTAALLMMLPLLIAYIFVQKYFVEGIERTGIVG
ncbi:carbohydrate ABC transporter permease [Haloplasma contractile]|uniref:ABC transporter membrane-spanning permease-sugar transport protein n=1 Tax=Haloplasma contractile SSD-17B TaxID=1033810 RepID=F7PRD3_9MOLU|nr:carbohydrate ABC transporter permease [Haloplasma contractile]ERJ11741.1 ABC transporter membrane-spanning permease-sugar transport protein [Haloplasma contractile SSD-17B]